MLAIAALIIAGVLVAVSGAQKSRRDTQRKDDAGKVVSYIEQWASNHNGDYPDNTVLDTTFKTQYASSLKDPSSGAAYTLQAGTVVAAGTSVAVGTMAYKRSAKCLATGDGSYDLGTPQQLRTYALVVGLEQGGVACYDNN